MALEPVSTAGLFALAMGLIRVIEKLIEKFVGKKDNTSGKLASMNEKLDNIDEKIDKFSDNMAKTSASLERQAETLDRLERRLEVTTDAVVETRLRVMSNNSH